MATILAARRPEHGDVTKIPTPPLQAAALFINFFFPVVALVAVGLRFYSRARTRQWGIDDFLMAVAMICSLLMCGPFYMYIKLNYFGWRQENVPEFDPAPGKWWFYLAQLFYNPVLALVKASVLVFLLRLGGQKPGVRWAIHALNLFNGLQAVAIFLVALLQCLPISANWDPAAMENAKCVDVSFHVTISCLTIFTDILVLALPFWIFLGLQMPRAAKLAVIGIFMLGLAVTVVGIVRLVNVYQLFYDFDPNKDPYHDIGLTLNVVEVNVAIISASAPALRPLFRIWLPSLFGGSSLEYDAAKYGNQPTTYGGGSASRSGLHHRDTTSHLGNAPGKQQQNNHHHHSIALKSIRAGNGRAQHTECRGVSPSGSEEEIMTYNGIMRTTDVHVQYGSENNHTADDQSRSSSDFKHAGETKPAAI